MLQENGIVILKESSTLETEALGFFSPNKFLNSIILAETTLTPENLIRLFLKIEMKLGRLRQADGYSDRTVDLDLIFYGDLIIKGKTVEVPHPRMQERMFVLEPLAEVAPDWLHPVLKKTVRELKKDLQENEDRQAEAL